MIYIPYPRLNCLTTIYLAQQHILIYRVRTGPGKPGKSWNFIVASPGNRLLVLESSKSVKLK